MCKADFDISFFKESGAYIQKDLIENPIQKIKIPQILVKQEIQRI